MADEILDELWKVKDGLARECDHDLRRLFEKLKAAQKSPRGEAVDRTGLRTAAPTRQ